MPYYNYGRGIGRGLEAIADAISAVQGMKIQLAAQKARMEYETSQQQQEFLQKKDLIDQQHKIDLDTMTKQNELTTTLTKLREISDTNQKIIASNYSKGYVLRSGIIPDNSRILNADDFEPDASNPDNIPITQEMISTLGPSAKVFGSSLIGKPLQALNNPAFNAAREQDMAREVYNRQLDLSDRNYNNALKLAESKGEIQTATKADPTLRRIIDSMKAELGTVQGDIDQLSSEEQKNINLMNAIDGDDKESKEQKRLLWNEISMLRSSLKSKQETARIKELKYTGPQGLLTNYIKTLQKPVIKTPVAGTMLQQPAVQDTTSNPINFWKQLADQW